MVIIESNSQFKDFLLKFHTTECIVIPVFKDHSKHCINNNLLLIYVHLIKSNLDFILPISTLDCLNLDKMDINEFNKHLLDNSTKKYVIDKNCFMETDAEFVDIKLLEYISTNKLETNFDVLTNAHKFFYHLHGNIDNLNIYVPITKHIEYLNSLKNIVLDIINKHSGAQYEVAYKKINNIMLNVLSNIEKNGIYVTDNFSRQDLIVDNFVYSHYNIFTITNRPSCAFGGYSFSSIPKNSIDRTSIVSRFGDNGSMLMLDYNSYHLYLIADIIGETFIENPHTHFAKIYFDKDTITEEEYEDSKKITFQLLYGKIEKEFLAIPFFAKVDKFVSEIWNAYKADGVIYTKHFKRKLKTESYDQMNPQKLFNYYLQTLETENNMIILNELQSYLKNHKSKIILYIYDAILIDFNLSDGLEVIENIIRIMQHQNKYPVSASKGKNYHDLIRFY